MKFAHALTCLAIVALATASCNNPVATPIPVICNGTAIPAMQLLYPIPGTHKGSTGPAVLIYAESFAVPMTIELQQPALIVDTKPTALPSPLPSPIATISYPDSGTTLRAVVYPALTGSSKYDVIALPNIASGACTAPHVKLGSFTTR